MMFLKMDHIKTYTYLYKNGYFIDIVKTYQDKSVYLYNCDYGVKILCFGVAPETSNAKLLKMLENQIIEYIAMYKNDYMD